jgi:hypothetical protein
VLTAVFQPGFGDAGTCVDEGRAAHVGDWPWMAAAPAAWRLVERDGFDLAPSAETVGYVLYDAACSYVSVDGRTWRYSTHGGRPVWQDGVLPLGPASFAAPKPDGQAAMIMSLPSLWRAGGVTADIGLEKLMYAVFCHEMAHTRQFAAWNPRIEALAEAGGFGDDLDDDVVQGRFESDAAYTAAFRAEVAMLYAALDGDAAQAKAQAREALAMIEARRARWLTGADAKYAGLEDVFLTLEGVGQLAGYLWLAHPQGGALGEAAALPAMRRGGRQWSQEEGLAVMLVVRRLLPDWRERLFNAQPQMALEMLRAAAS